MDQHLTLNLNGLVVTARPTSTNQVVLTHPKKTVKEHGSE